MEIGIKNKLEMVVQDSDTARIIGSGTLDVLATPRLAELVEQCCYLSVSPFLKENESTVGAKIDLNHLSATPVGLKVVCTSELVEIDNRKLVFSFSVNDEAGLIATGTHIRYIIDVKRFLIKANSKNNV